MPRKVRRRESREGRRIPRTSTTPKPRGRCRAKYDDEKAAKDDAFRAQVRRRSREGRRIPRTSTTPKPRRTMPRKRTTKRKPRRTNSAHYATYAHLCHLCHLCCLRPFFLVLSITFRRYCRRLHLLRFFSSCFPVSVCVRSAGSVLCCSVVSGGFRLRRALGSGPAIPVDVSSR
ncbi:hypothetical protein BDB00DRAFT_249307 [Zychaea mexicana]|uniref:uncharacterized protein n=1 Tax=Zychaea mexicana TaxID=64656 RepID=UPI0022FDB116|nr:uncharacterized protein BDB00DRAFT_249307 [Zychaea mexicana]KAI9471382.1 hypothetical protein BDB00DRAFT_249307 [Zychaea mexicana]